MKIDTKVLTRLKKVEKCAYPAHMRSFSDVRDLSDLQEYCESETIKIFGNDVWYCIVTEDEVVDLASISGISLKEVFDLVKDLKIWFGGSVISMDCRASTSYRLMKVLARKGRISIHSEEEWDWEGEGMVEMTVSFL